MWWISFYRVHQALLAGKKEDVQPEDINGLLDDIDDPDEHIQKVLRKNGKLNSISPPKLLDFSAPQGNED